MNYIAFNDSFTNFSLSLSALVWLSERGNQKSFDLIESVGRERIKTMSIESDMVGLSRHDSMLILCVKELGSEVVSSSGSIIKLREIHGDKYIIRKHGGAEIVLEPSEIEWIEVK